MTNILGILTWLVTRKGYIANYAGDEDRQKIAKRLFNSVDECSWLPVLLMLALALLFCWFYHIPFNNMPGRHYRPCWKRLIGGLALVAVFVETFVCFYLMAKNPGFDWMLLVKASLMNTAYAALCYLLFTILFNKSGKSNAYPSKF